MMRWYLIITLLTASRLQAQSPAYMHFSVRDGLPSSLIYCGLQDKDGFVWFGTDKGLACFDGVRFHTYGMEEGLPDPEVLTLKLDSKGRMWIGCFQQKPCYMLHGKIITAAQDPLLDKVNFTSGRCDFSEDTDGSIWFTDVSHIAYHLLDNKVVYDSFPMLVTRFIRIDGKLFALGSAWICSIEADGTCTKFVNDQMSGFIKNAYYLGTRAINEYVLTANSNVVMLEKWNGLNFEMISMQKSPLGYVFSDQSNAFWLCTSTGGAFRYRDYKTGLKNPDVFLPQEKVNGVFDDNQGNLWFFTADNGVFLLPENAPVKFSIADGLPSDNIRSLTAAGSGILAAGDDEGNVSFISDNLINTVSFGSRTGANMVRQILYSGKDSIWSCTDGGILLKTRDNVEKFPIQFNPKSIVMQGDKLWFGASHEFGYILPGTRSVVSVNSLYRFTFVQKDFKGHVWAGAIAGLFSEFGNYQKNWGDLFPELKTKIISIQSAGPDKLWVATPRSGLLRVFLENEKIVRLEQVKDDRKKPFQNIQSLFVDKNNPEKIWIATNRGVFGLDQTGAMVHFDSHNGLSNDDVNSVYMNQDTLWAGTTLGLTRIIVSSPKKQSVFGTRITGLRYAIKETIMGFNFIGDNDPDKTRELPADAANIELELAGMDYGSRGNVRFECLRTEKLLPFSYWTPGNLFNLLKSGFRGKTDTFEINNGNLYFGYKIPSGKYAIQTFAFNNAGIKSSLPDGIALVLLPNWYETIWAWLFFWSVVVLLIWRYYRNRIAFRELNAAASELQLQALQSQMNPHFVGNSINAIQQFFYPPNPSKASEYIALFTRLLRQTMFFSERTFIPFREEVAYDLDYLNMVQLRFGDRFQYSITGTDQIPEDTPFPAMILQPLLENATIHGMAETGVSRLSLDFRLDQDKIQVTLSDNGVGMDETIRRKSRSTSVERKSKGLELLHKKSQTINSLYGIDLQVVFSGKSASTGGTQVTLIYSPGKLKNQLL